jgi:hypothetical protein
MVFQPGGQGQGFAPLTRLSRKSVTFDGTTGLGEAATTTTFFTVTGEILVVYLSPYVVGTLTQSGATPTLALGVTNSTALFIAATTATTLAIGEFWTEATGGGTAAAGIAIPAALREILVTSNIIGTVGGTNNINGGTLRLDMWWIPLSADAAVT